MLKTSITNEVIIPNKASTGNFPILSGILNFLSLSILYLNTIALKLTKAKVRNRNAVVIFATSPISPIRDNKIVAPPIINTEI